MISNGDAVLLDEGGKVLLGWHVLELNSAAIGFVESDRWVVLNSQSSGLLSALAHVDGNELHWSIA